MLNRTSRRSLLQSTGLLVAGSASPGLAMLAGCAAAPPAPMAETTMQEMTASDALSRDPLRAACRPRRMSSRCSTGPSASRT